jgi:hypothetical protein
VTAITEYGVRRAHPVTGAERIQWPTPGTGLLALPGGTVDGTDLDGIWEALAAHPSLEGASVVVRSYDVEEVAKPAPALPTTPGSVVRASTPDGAVGLWGLTADVSDPWVSMTNAADEWWREGSDLTDVEILFDAGTAP